MNGCEVNMLYRGSKIVMTENAYLTNEIWGTEIVPHLIQWLRKAPVVCDHSDWWVTLYLDGFQAHVDTLLSQQAFADAKILIVKENSNTSHVNQAFDRHVGN